MALTFTVWNVTTYAHHNAELNRMQDRVDSLARNFAELDQRGRIVRRKIQEFDLTVLDTQALKANEVIEWKAFSWTRLFNRLEGVTPWNVQMHSIRPVFRGRRGDEQVSLASDGIERIPVAVEGTARDMLAMLDFQRALMADPYFDFPEPERSDKLESGEWQFSLRFDYYPAGAQLIEPDTAPAPTEAEVVPDADATAAAAVEAVEGEPQAETGADQLAIGEAPASAEDVPVPAAVAEQPVAEPGEKPPVGAEAKAEAEAEPKAERPRSKRPLRKIRRPDQQGEKTKEPQ
jgi:hypothetical protein